MLSDDHLKYLVDFTDSNDCFPGVDIAGGICYFLWERMYSGKCTITNIANGPENVLERSLHETKPFIRYNQAISIIHKVAAHKETVLSTKVSSQKPFGLRTYVQPEAAGDLILRYSGGTGPYPRNKVLAGFDMIDKWKVMTSYLTYDHAGIPAQVASAYAAALKCRNIDTVICLIALRRILEFICHDKQAKGQNLWRKIEDLSSKGILPPELKHASIITKNYGNMGAHDSQINVSQTDINLIFEFVKYILDYLYVLPAKLKEMQEKMGRPQATVPDTEENEPAAEIEENDDA